MVTGAASGIGLATSVAFAREGAAGVALIDLSASALESALTKVKEASSRAHFIATTHILDITDEAGVEKTLDQIYTTFGRIDYAVNNAGVCKHDDGGVAHNNRDMEENAWSKSDRIILLPQDGAEDYVEARTEKDLCDVSSVTT